MKISKSAAVVVSSALVTILVLVAVRTQDPVSGALPTGPTTPTPTVATRIRRTVDRFHDACTCQGAHLQRTVD